jgi:hypothetical protein
MQHHAMQMGGQTAMEALKNPKMATSTTKIHPNCTAFRATHLVPDYNETSTKFLVAF